MFLAVLRAVQKPKTLADLRKLEPMRITKTTKSSKAGGTLWIIEGKISGEYALLLEETYQELSPQERGGLYLNLENVSYVDQKGTEVLLGMEGEGVKLEALTPFLPELISRYR